MELSLRVIFFKNIRGFRKHPKGRGTLKHKTACSASTPRNWGNKLSLISCWGGNTKQGVPRERGQKTWSQTEVSRSKDWLAYKGDTKIF